MDLVIMFVFILGVCLALLGSFEMFRGFLKRCIIKFLTKNYLQNNKTLYQRAIQEELDYVELALLEARAKEMSWMISVPLYLFLLTMGVLTWISLDLGILELLLRGRE